MSALQEQEEVVFGDRYWLTKPLAVGGMAEVFLARHQTDAGFQKEVVIKRLRPELAKDERVVSMFRDEARVSGLLNHSNSVHVFDAGTHEGLPFMAMEYIRGEELNQLCRRGIGCGEFLPLEHAVELIRQAALAMGYYHNLCGADGKHLELVHCDISPNNLLIGEDGYLQVIDFGISQFKGQQYRDAQLVPGKLSYMSPEQARRGTLDHRSDIFSLGSVLYEMLTRVPPFTATNEMDLLIKVRDAKYRRISDIVPNVPPEIEKITDKCLARSRANRFQSSDDVHRALRSFLNATQPNYSRSHLGRYVRKQFGPEIERELRMLEEYVVSADPSSDVGENLISKVLGPDAEFSRFSPHADGTQVGDSEVQTDVRGDDDEEGPTHVSPEEEERTEINASPQALGSRPQGNLQKASTALIDAPDTHKRVRSMPDEIDEDLHNAPTLILDSRRR